MAPLSPSTYDGVVTSPVSREFARSQGSWTRRRALQVLVLAGTAGRTKSAFAKSTAPAWLTLPPTPKLPALRRSETASVNGTKIYFAQFGEAGPPVLMLHGGLGNLNYWGHQVAKLANQFSVTVMDTRGHGRSPVTSRAFSYELFAQDAIALLDYLQIPAASIVAWSDGGVTGLELAMTQPDRVVKLFAFGANSTPSGMKPGGARTSVFAAYAARCRGEYAVLSPNPDKWPQLVQGLGAMWRSEPNYADQELARIKAPTTIADGAYDEIIKAEHTRHMASVIPGARLAVLRDTSHFAMLQDPVAFNQALIEFLSA
jgi:pimeloyl-ACP methyl ester carboxylesterase